MEMMGGNTKVNSIGMVMVETVSSIFPTHNPRPMITLSLVDQWTAIPPLERILWAIALMASALFVVQMVMTFLSGDDGGGHSDEAIADDDGAGQQLFTVKNLIAFFTLFGWVGLGCLQMGLSVPLALFIAAIAGSAMVGLMMFLFGRISAMKHSGTLSLSNAIGATGSTYLTIPAARAGLGKVHVRVQGGIKELDAMTEDLASIPTGTLVKVTRIIDDRILLVSSHLDH